MDVQELLDEKGNQVITVQPGDTVPDAVQTLASNDIGAVVVTDDQGTMTGILSERDISRGVKKHGAGLMGKQVQDLMSNKVVTCTPHCSIVDVLALMNANNIRHLPVMDAQKVMGVISIRDATTVWLNALEEENETLRRMLANID